MKTRKHRAGTVSYSGRAFRGTYTAVVTPFTPSGKVDYGRICVNTGRQVKGGVQGVVPVGTTGESPTVSFEEHSHIIAESVRAAKGRIKVIAGTGANSTEEAVYLTKEAERAGADGSLQVAPYYNKPSQDGLFHHFKTVADATKLPIILYNIPGRCGIDIALDTVCALRQVCPNIVGIKVANGSLDYVSELRLSLGDEFTILSGDDSLTVPMMSLRADGVISVVSNVIPDRVVKMVNAMLSGDLAIAWHHHYRLFPLVKAVFRENNPAGIKYAMELLGWDSGVLKLPVVRISKSADEVRTALRSLDLLR